MHKPSLTWPIECVPKEGRARVTPTQTNPPPRPGHADTLLPSSSQVGEQLSERLEAGQEEGRVAHADELKHEEVQDQAAMLQEGSNSGDRTSPDASSSGDQDSANRERGDQTPEFESLDFWEPKPPKVLMKDPNDRPIELRSQIQLYATNEYVIFSDTG